MQSEKEYGLLGRDFIYHSETIIETFSADTEYLPCIRGFEASVKLSDASKPMRFFKARSVPVHLKPKVDFELDVLERQSIAVQLSGLRNLMIVTAYA